MIKILIAILVFGVIIAVHEFGHFTVAKLCGIRVNKFAIGMGPRLLKHQWGETEYSLRLLPIGGFCAMEGEDAESTDERAFCKKNVPKRFAVVVAGAVMNILLGFILLIITTCMGDLVATTTVRGFQQNENKEIISESYQSGLRVGDEIIRINGMRIFTDSDLAYKINYTAENSFTIEVNRDGERVVLENVKFNNPATGHRADFGILGVEKSFGSVLSYAARDTISVARMIWQSLFDLVTGKYGFDEVSGPVGIVSAIGTAAQQGETIRQHLESLISLMTMITINVGIFNLLPLPALDGGRLVFLVVEAIRRKPVKPEHEGLVHVIGLALLLLLMVAVTFNDIRNLF